MFRELAGEFPDLKLHEPAALSALTAIETGLGTRLPPDLRALLLETNGISGDFGDGVVWSAEQILESNRTFRTYPDFSDLYMPFDPLLFFGDNGGGDQFAFIRTPERDEDVFVWDHETDSRLWAANSLHDYVHRALDGSDGDWWR